MPTLTAIRPAPAAPAAPSATLERRPRHAPAGWAWRALDEIDHGALLVEPDGTVLHANRLAQDELAAGRCLRNDAGQLAGADAAATRELQRGLASAAAGRRMLLALQRGTERLAVACVPLGTPYDSPDAPVLLMLERRPGAQGLAMTFFARHHGLTPAEESVLRGLCDGRAVQDIAQANGVCESTVRTQVRTLRDKTRAGSIRELVQRVAALPPLRPAQLACSRTAAAQCWA